MIIFENKGLIPIEAIMTMGVNVKDKPYAIGFFGTGLKYAIAVLLRLNCSVVLYRGTRKYTFSCKFKKIRSKTFGLVYMNDEPMGFTTELGKNWEAWQAFRELWCNAYDEDRNSVVYKADNAGAKAGYTIIKVCGDEIEQAYLDRYRTVLLGDADLHLNGLDVQFKQSSSIYYRGIRAMDDEDLQMLFTYNILTETALTEDRTIKYGYWARNIIVRAILQSNNRNFLREFLLAPEGYWEHDVNMDLTGVVPSDLLLELLLENKWKLSKGAKSLFKSKKIQSISSIVDKVQVALTTTQQAVVDRAIKLCTDSGYPVPLKIIFVDQLPNNREVEYKNGNLVYQVNTLEYGSKYLATSLLRETLKLNEGKGSVVHQMACIILNVKTEFVRD